MVGLFGRVRTSFGRLWRGHEGLNLKSIRPAKLVYSLAYTFELLFYAFHKTFLHVDTKLFGLHANMLMYIGHIVVSLAVMLLWSKKFKPLIYTSLGATILGFAAFLFLPDGIPKLLCAVLTMAGLGGCVSAARCGFAFAINNAERLLGVVLLLGNIMLLHFGNAIFPDGSFWNEAVFAYIYPILALAGLAFCLLRFKEDDLEYKEESTPEDSKGLYWALAVFIVYFALEGYVRLMGSASYPYESLMLGIGMFIAVTVFVAMLLRKKNIWHIFNLYLVIAIVVALLNTLAYSPPVDTAINLLQGLSRIGWIAVLYLLACAQRRFASLKLLKQCTIVFVILSPITTLSDELFEMLFPQQMPLISLIYILVVALAFFLASPYLAKYLFSAVWIDDLQKTDMGRLREKVEQADRFENYGLTPREKEVAALLLAACTVRMIAGELKISQSTVNMHTANLYRKLDINSKAELFKKFGVAEQPEGNGGEA